MQAYLGGPGTVKLLLREGSGPETEIQTAHLWPQGPGAGLAVTVGTDPPIHRVDPFVGASVLGADSFTEYDPPPAWRDPELRPLAARARPQGSTIRWEGDLYSDSGLYIMELRTDAHARLTIDNRTVLDLCDNTPLPGGIHMRGGYPPKSADITLKAGPHSVRLDMDPTGAANGLEWSWVRPDGIREIVPPARLRLPESSGDKRIIEFPEIAGHIECGR